ncbi:MAG: LysR family transcriptional regulator [Lachnospiraceae bacterium]|nr:LysR family transcriptional regulator [Lachnospiraceae bacterium]
MEMKEMLYIVTIAEEGSISRAAEKLYMAQSSLSQFLQQYEAELGTKLFRRTSTGVYPTDSGKVVLEHAQKILQQYHLMRSQVSDIEGLISGHITLGISTFRGMYMLPKVMRAFYQKYPHIHVDIIEANSMALEEEMMRGKLDLALLVLPLSRLKTDTELLVRDEVILVTSPEHELMQAAKRREDGRLYVDLADTAPYEYILSDRDTILGHIARKLFAEAGFQPISRNTNITAPFAAAMARQGLGLAFTYRSCIGDYPEAAYLSVGDEGVWLDLALVYPAGSYRSLATREFARIFRESLGV